MKKFRYIAIFALLGASYAVSAQAQTPTSSPTLWREVEATSLYWTYVYVSAGGRLTVDAVAAGDGVDPVAHVLDGETGSELAFADDPDDGSGLDAHASWRNTGPSARRCLVLVRAFKGAFAGAADVTVAVDGQTVASRRATVAGAATALPTSRWYMYETALQPGGVTGTMLLGLDGEGHALSWDTTGGVGLASRMPHTTGLVSVVVGTSGSAGAVRVYANPLEDDLDGDGLGTALERELGLCNGRDACNTGAVTAADTDRDGIEDGAEVFGVDDIASVRLPQWGADPRHKDVFVEVDWRSPAARPNAADASRFAHLVRDYYARGRAADLGNPDGVDGVAVHLDLGVDPPDAADAALFGDWGGSTVNLPPNIERGAARDMYMSEARRGLYHYALAYDGSAGQAGAPGATQQFGWSAESMQNNAARLAHELGHNLNLEHHGNDAWGRTNCNPLYQSIMNYAYSYDPTKGFSQGGFSGFALNPARVLERDVLPVGFDASALRGAPFYFTVEGRSVDWNRDDRISDGLIRSPIAWASGSSKCPSHSMNSPRNDLRNGIQPIALGALTTGGAPPPGVEVGPAILGTPDLVYAAARIYSVLARANNTIEVRSSAASGPDASGNCAISDRPGGLCSAWSQPVALSIPWPASEADRTVRGASANYWSGALHVAFVNASGRVYRASYAISDGSLVSRGTARREAVDASGEPELATINVPTFRGSGRGTALALFWRDATTSETRWSISDSPDPELLVAQGALLLTGTGAPMRVAFAPTVVPFPFAGATNPGASACGAFVDTTQQVHVLCLDRSSATLRWNDVSAAAFPGTDPSTDVRPGFAFQLVRRADGAAHYGVSGWGQFWLATRPPSDPPWVRVSQGVDGRAQLTASNTPAFSMRDRFDGNLRITPDGGLTLLADYSLSALKALHVEDHELADGVRRQEVSLMPFFDGTFDEPLSDGNDARVMYRGLCLGLRGEAFCGAPSSTPFGL